MVKYGVFVVVFYVEVVSVVCMKKKEEVEEERVD